MAIDQDKAAALSAQIERIRTGQLIPDPKEEVEGEGHDATLVRWCKGTIEKTKDSYKYFSCVPLNDAMGPAFPKGDHIIFSECTDDLKDGDVVVAALCVRNLEGSADPLVEIAEVIRRYSRLADGRIRLTPLLEGYSSWTDGDITRYGLLEIYPSGVAVPYEWKQVNPHGDGVIFMSKSTAAA